jgi:hypothetical protein
MLKMLFHPAIFLFSCDCEEFGDEGAKRRGCFGEANSYNMKRRVQSFQVLGWKN